MKNIPFSYSIMFGLLLLFVVGTGYLLAERLSLDKEQQEISGKESNSVVNSLRHATSTAHQSRQKIEGYDGPYTYDLGSINDSQLTEFVINIALDRCPFYENGGATYRSCIYDLREQALANANIASSTLETIEKDCSRITKEHIDSASTVAHEVHSLCVTEKILSLN